jgi:hypothetical protein
VKPLVLLVKLAARALESGLPLALVRLRMTEPIAIR